MALREFCKPCFWVLILCAGALAGCSTNAATGKSQFTGLMSPSQEVQVGASEHQKIVQQFGLYENKEVSDYVSRIGARVTKNTERPDVVYKFFVLDSPIVNAFALPGGYIYVSRGLLALANSEAELAAVLAHEAGHITGRHSAERYSTGVVTSLGASILSAVLDSSGASQALGVGSDLFLKSYSRGQENEADTLGLRYLSRGGYHPSAMASFLDGLRRQTELDSRAEGRSEPVSYFSTHPATADRVAKTRAEAGQYKAQGDKNRDAYLNVINGITYGDSAKQGFVKDGVFYHTELGFAFDVPPSYRVANQPSQVVAVNQQSGAVMVFDMAPNKGSQDAMSYLRQTWMQKQNLEGVERISVNGMNGATGQFSGQVNGKPMDIRLITIEWSPGLFARYQIGVPRGLNAGEQRALRQSTYSFRRLSEKEKQAVKPNRIRIVAAKAGDTVNTMARRQPLDNLQVERFRVLNGLSENQAVIQGDKYKTVSEY